MLNLSLFFLLQSCQVDGTAHVVQLYNWTLQHKTCHQSFGSMQICGLMAFTSAEGVTLRSANVRSTCTRLMNLQSYLRLTVLATLHHIMLNGSAILAATHLHTENSLSLDLINVHQS